MSDPYLGEIRIFAGNFAPVGWSFCNGSLVAISENEALFALVGTTYGGDGINTFGLPNLQGRAPMHQGNGLGLTSRTMGETAGTETVTLVTNNLPQHTHNLVATTAAGTTAAPSGMMFATMPSTFHAYTNPQSGDTLVESDFASNAIGSSGGSQPHENMMPYMAINYIIALEGIFPSQN